MLVCFPGPYGLLRSNSGLFQITPKLVFVPQSANQARTIRFRDAFIIHCDLHPIRGGRCAEATRLQGLSLPSRFKDCTLTEIGLAFTEGFRPNLKQLLADLHEPLPLQPGLPDHSNYKFQRNGVAELFMLFEPLVGKGHVEITDQRRRLEWAEVMRILSDELYPEVDKSEVYRLLRMTINRVQLGCNSHRHTRLNPHDGLWLPPDMLPFAICIPPPVQDRRHRLALHTPSDQTVERPTRSGGTYFSRTAFLLHPLVNPLN